MQHRAFHCLLHLCTIDRFYVLISRGTLLLMAHRRRQRRTRDGVAAISFGYRANRAIGFIPMLFRVGALSPSVTLPKAYVLIILCISTRLWRSHRANCLKLASRQYPLLPATLAAIYLRGCLLLYRNDSKTFFPDFYKVNLLLYLLPSELYGGKSAITSMNGNPGALSTMLCL